MQLNKIGQGLAVSAVSALVITGLTLSAAPAVAADGAGVRLLSQQDGVASVRRDADAPIGTTVSLLAEQLDPGVQVTFEFNADPTAGDADPGWTAIEPSSPTSAAPYVATEWSPEPSLVGTSIALRAVATTAATEETPATATYSTRRNVALSGQGAPAHAVTLGARSQFFQSSTGGFFSQPYADAGRTASLLAVSGTTSATDGTVELSAWNAADGSFQGQVDAAVSPTDLKTSSNTPTTTYVEGGQFTGVLDISAFDAGDGDALALRAERDSDSVVPVPLVAQTITWTGVSNSLQAGPQGTTPVTLDVRDQDSRAIVGAEVRRSSDGGLVGYTDAVGRVATTQPNSTTESYYVNTTDADGFEEGVDLSTGDVVTDAYVPRATSTEAVLADGTVFDDREYADGDIALQVVDVEGKPFAGEQELAYSLHPTGQEPSDVEVVMTDADGRAVVPFDPTGPDGEYTLTFSPPFTSAEEEETQVTFVAGDAVLGLTPLAGAAPSGGQITYAGTLTVEGEPLSGRAVDLAYTRGTEQPPGTEADAGLGAQRALTHTTTTVDDGSFSVTVADLAETGSPAETGGRLRVDALGDVIDATADFTQVATVPPTTPVTPAPVTPDKGTAKLRLTGSDAGARKDRLRIAGPRSIAGEKVRVYAKAGRTWRPVKAVRLDRKGDATVTVRDRNADAVTRYRVRLLPNPRFEVSTSKVLRLR